MFEPRDSSARRNLVDGGFVVLLLSVAIASGYVILSPGSKSAPQTAIVGTVEARSPSGWRWRAGAIRVGRARRARRGDSGRTKARRGAKGGGIAGARQGRGRAADRARENRAGRAPPIAPSKPGGRSSRRRTRRGPRRSSRAASSIASTSRCRGLDRRPWGGDPDRRRGCLQGRARAAGRRAAREAAGVREDVCGADPGPGGGRAQAADDQGRLPHLLRYRRSRDSRARAGPRRPHRDQRGRDRRQGRPGLDPLSDGSAPGTGRRRAGTGHPQGLRQPHGRSQGPGHLHDRAS